MPATVGRCVGTGVFWHWVVLVLLVLLVMGGDTCRWPADSVVARLMMWIGGWNG